MVECVRDQVVGIGGTVSPTGAVEETLHPAQQTSRRQTVGVTTEEGVEYNCPKAPFMPIMCVCSDTK